MLAFLGFMLIVAAGLMAWLTVQAIRFPGRMRRLRELGSIVYGRVESADWHTVWGDDGTHQDVLSVDYTFDVDGRTHAETIRLGRDQAAFGHAPPSGFRVAILYVNDRLWELL